MALAALRLIDDNGDQLRFHADVGSNAWYQWALGDGEQVRMLRGVPVLEAPVHTSPLLGPVPRAALGRTTFVVPRRLIDRRNRHLQLMSFRTEDRTGPAISAIVALPLSGRGRFYDAALPDIPLPARPFALSATESIPRIPMQTHVEPFSFVERPLMSHAMFFGAITGLLNSVLPKIAPIVGQVGPILGKLLGGNGEAKKLTDEDIGKAITELLKVISSASKDPAKAQAISQALAASHRELCRHGNGMASPVQAQAMWWQALLNPETLKAAGEAVKSLLEAADKSDQAFKQHLRDLIKGVDDPGLDKLLEGMSLRTAALGGEVKFTLDERTRLTWAPPMAMLAGRERPVYRHGSDLSLAFTVDTPKPIAKATLLVAVKDIETLEPLARRAIKLGSVSSGPLAPVQIPKTALGKLVPGKEALLCATLVWNNREQRRGTGIEERFTIAGELIFERIEEGSELVPLTDTERYRAFWHKVWQETLTEETRRFELDTKYYMRLDPQRSENGRIETLIQSEKGSLWKETGRMKSGLLVALPALNATAQALGGKALSPSELEALRGKEVVTRLSLAARHKIELAGRPGDSVALWVYPEVKMQKFVFQRARDVDPSGWIRSFEEHTAMCPVPALLHFIGVTSAQDATSSSPLLNGMKVVFDHKVALYPVNLQSKKREVRRGGRAQYVN